ncbi:MAG: hypothetical protein Q9218_002924 [Villophora microphyllina]
MAVNELSQGNPTIGVGARDHLLAAKFFLIDFLDRLEHSQLQWAAAEYRRPLHSYLVSIIGIVAPKLVALIEKIVSARLMSHAGSLTSLSKYPASTAQILGVEKALWSAFKTQGNTRSYGIICHMSLIGRAGPKNKGRIRGSSFDFKAAIQLLKVGSAGLAPKVRDVE